MRTFLLTLALTGAVCTAGYALLQTSAAEAAAEPVVAPVGAPVPAQAPASNRLVVHEWGTFTSFSGSDGVPTSFYPNNEDLPSFVYHPYDENSKSGRLRHGGLVSMETPVVYFYADRETNVKLKVGFPQGWITEWYPAASLKRSAHPNHAKTGGDTIEWNVKLTPNEAAKFPTEKKANHYYAARETDATPLSTEVVTKREDEDYDPRVTRGGVVLQREKFLFYRGVGTFAPPVTVKALGGGKVRVMNASGGRATGLVLVNVQGNKVGFRVVGDIDANAKADSTIPEATGTKEALAAELVKSLTATGLYEREAVAMVKTWDDAWFQEEGTRLLYLVPRARTDELLPLAVEPKPTEVVRVLVGRHDFLTPEQEAVADKELARIVAANAELHAAQETLRKLGRFSSQAQDQAAKRLQAKPVAAQR